MAKHHRIGAENRPPRISYLSQSDYPNPIYEQPTPDIMSLDESETLLSGHYVNTGGISGGTNDRISILSQQQPITILEMSSNIPTNHPYNKTPQSQPSTEQTTIASGTGKCVWDWIFLWKMEMKKDKRLLRFFFCFLSKSVGGSDNRMHDEL